MAGMLVAEITTHRGFSVVQKHLRRRPTLDDLRHLEWRVLDLFKVCPQKKEESFALDLLACLSCVVNIERGYPPKQLRESRKGKTKEAWRFLQNVLEEIKSWEESHTRLSKRERKILLVTVLLSIGENVVHMVYDRHVPLFARQYREQEERRAAKKRKVSAHSRSAKK